MNNIIHNDLLFIHGILPYIDPRLFRIYELKSVSKRFKELIPNCKHKSKYIKVPSQKYKNLKDAYYYVKELLYYNIPQRNLINPPEIWLDEGHYGNLIGKISCPIVIRGMGINRTIITRGLHFHICDDWYKGINYLKVIIDSLSINHNINSINPNLWFHGIYGDSEKFINILSCKIEKCNGIGIYGHKICVNIKNSIICDNNQAGIHMWDKSILLADDLEIFNCSSGITIGNLRTKKNIILNDIKIHHNDKDGLSVGGWDPLAKVIVKGNKSDISYNNLILKQKYVYGVSTDYRGKIIFKGLDKNVSHDNYNGQNINSRSNGTIIFTS